MGFRRSSFLSVMAGICLSVILQVFRTPLFAAPVEQPDSVRRQALERLVASTALDSNAFAVMVTDLRSGRTLSAYSPSLPLVPASIMKCVTTASLLRQAGPGWRYSTHVYADGPVSHGVLEGNLVVEGACDPSLNSLFEPKSPDFIAEIRDALLEAHIDSIAGKIIIDEHRFAGPSVVSTWGSGDLSASYGTGSHAFNFENNASGKRAVTDPSSRFGSRLSSTLAAAGINIGSNNLREGRRRKLFSHNSATVDEIMRSCMMRSDNLFAESMLRTYSSLRGKDGSTASGARLEADFWRSRGADSSGVIIVDGSGLSRANRLTARFLTDILRIMAGDVDYASFFPLAGKEGTLRRFMAGTRLDSYLAMKTGSMKGVQCYAGYLLDESFAPTHTVVVICNNLRDRGAFRAALSDYFLSIF